ncbi:hypothetical protein ALC53_05676 [Atta colombica]|uniref:DUF7044 domain-containing protein n=1 Tax=Atta colombica TaxID=520822 RepID=A0A151I4I4_9HYME|nr:hypothetical protein ALC53_05676 [Atta colombica]
MRKNVYIAHIFYKCLFPAKWEGAWFQSGVRQSILISKNELSTKGRCLHNEGDKYLLVDQ